MKPLEFVEKYCIRSLVCCFSGGKDSLVSTHYVMSELADLEISKVVLHVDTTVGIPGVQDYVREVCKRFGWRLEIVRPSRSFWEMASKWGMPTLRTRWCCFKLKIRPMLDFALRLKHPVGMVTGMRRAESSRRRDVEYVYRRKRKGKLIYNYHPILEWKDVDVENYVKEHDLPVSPVAKKLGFSGECYCGVFAGWRELMKVRALYPEFIERFAELEKCFKDSQWTFYAGNKRLRAKDLLAQKTLDEVM